MTALIPYSPQSPSYTCSAWKLANDYAGYPLELVSGILVGINFLGHFLDYQACDRQNELLSRNIFIAMLANPFMEGGAVALVESSKYAHSSRCSHFDPAFQNKMADVSQKMFDLIADLEARKFEATLLRSNYEQLYRSLSRNWKGNEFTEGAARFLQSYFPNDAHLKSTHKLDMNQLEAYFNEALKAPSSLKDKITLNKWLDVINSSK